MVGTGFFIVTIVSRKRMQEHRVFIQQKENEIHVLPIASFSHRAGGRDFDSPFTF
jgi:hypothetical protein